MSDIQPNIPFVLDALRDKHDLKVLACAVVGQVDVLITGDNDLLVLGQFEQIIMQTPRTFVESLQP